MTYINSPADYEAMTPAEQSAYRCAVETRFYKGGVSLEIAGRSWQSFEPLTTAPRWTWEASVYRIAKPKPMEVRIQAKLLESVAEAHRDGFVVVGISYEPCTLELGVLDTEAGRNLEIIAQSGQKLIAVPIVCEPKNSKFLIVSDDAALVKVGLCQAIHRLGATSAKMNVYGDIYFADSECSAGLALIDGQRAVLWGCWGNQTIEINVADPAFERHLMLAITSCNHGTHRT